MVRMASEQANTYLIFHVMVDGRFTGFQTVREVSRLTAVVAGERRVKSAMLTCDNNFAEELKSGIFCLPRYNYSLLFRKVSSTLRSAVVHGR